MKEIKSLDDQIKLLKNNKRVVFDNINESDSKEFLLKFNYINTVTPYKHNFHKGKDDDGNHIYHETTDFNQYVKAFDNGVSTEQRVLKEILMFERVFTSVFSYYFLIYLKHEYNSSFPDYLKMLNGRYNKTADHNVIKNELRTKARTERYINYLNSIQEKYDKYEGNCFIMLDRLTLGELSFLFRVSDYEVNKRVFSKLKKFGFDLGVKHVTDFKKKLIIVKDIRNVIAHNNSLEIHRKFVYDKIEGRERKRNFYSDKPCSEKDITQVISYFLNENRT